jgi:hypothetical protein
MNEEMQEISSTVDTLLATQAGITVALTSLIAMHPNYQQLQMHLVSTLEIALNGSLGAVLTERQKIQARDYVEVLQQMREVRGKIDPLG